MTPIEHASPTDLDAVLSLYPLAFPDEDLTPLIRELWQNPDEALSLICRANAGISAHIAFTRCSVFPGDQSGALLGPLAVRPNAQAQGLGTSMITSGFDALKAAGIAHVFVLGDPGYYSRFGFAQETRIAPPYAMPPKWAAAWQSLTLPGGDALAQGTLRLPTPWMKRELWLP